MADFFYCSLTVPEGRQKFCFTICCGKQILFLTIHNGGVSLHTIVKLCKQNIDVESNNMKRIRVGHCLNIGSKYSNTSLYFYLWREIFA